MKIKRKKFLKRIFHGPGTIGAMGYHLSKWQRSNGYLSDCVVYSDDGNRQLYDINLNINNLNKLNKLKEKIKLLYKVIKTYDLIHFCSVNTFLPFNLDLPVLRLFRKKLIMTFCGTDIRLKSIHSKRNKYTHLYPYSKFHSDLIIQIRMIWCNFFINKFFAVRDLYPYANKCIPKSKIATKPWLNNIGFSTNSTIYKTPIENQPNFFKIVHAPSNPLVKGTKYIRNEINKLKHLGFEIEYIELIGVPNKKVQEIISDCDIVVDQILLGEIGTLSFEGMGLGKPVVAYLPERIKKEFLPKCPVVNATIENLAERLIDLMNDSSKRYKLSIKGREYVEENLNFEKLQLQIIKEYKKIGF